MRARALWTICRSVALSRRSQPMCGWRPRSAASNTDSGSEGQVPGDVAAAQVTESVTVEFHVARCRRSQTGQGMERETLAATVAAQYGDEFARSQLERKIREQDALSGAHTQPGGRQ